MDATRPGTHARLLRSPLLGRLGLALVIAAAFLAPGCENGEHHFSSAFWSVTIENRTGITLGVDLDGSFVATIADGTLTTVPNVEEGHHVLEAFDPDGHLVASRSIELTRDFVWVLE